MSNEPDVGQSVTVLCLLRGSISAFARGKHSAIVKEKISGAVRILRAGLSGDEQADRRHHGGPEKAIHHYPHDHYPFWRAELKGDAHSGARDVLLGAGAFGENVSTHGLTEANVCAGDLWRLGTALIQVSQPRQPCWKLSERFGVADMARRVQNSGRTGWYYRVREEGQAQEGDELRLVDRSHPDWPLSRILNALYVDCLDRSTLDGMGAIDALPVSFRELARKRLKRGVAEDWSERLDGGE